MSEHLRMYKYWFRHWSNVDFASDLMDEQPWEDLVEEYDEDSIKYAVKKDWISLYNSCGGIITDLPPEFDEEDEDAYVEMVVNGENMAAESVMLKGDEKYKPDLESVNDLYGTPYDDCDDTETDEDSEEDSEEEVQTPKRKRVECPPAPKKALKRQRSNSMDTQYDSDEDEEQKLLEVHEMNHPKRIKV